MTEPSARPALQASRLMLGFALAPMLPAFYSALFFAQPWAFPIGVALAYPTALLLGLPLFLGLRRQGWLSWWQLSMGGTLCALPLVLLYWQVGTPPHLEAFDWLNGLSLAAWGGFSGLSFWLLAISGKTPVRLHMLFGVGF